MPRLTVCIACGVPTTNGSRCFDCARQRQGFAAGFRPSPRQPTYDVSAWRKLSRRIREEWVREHGQWCPGWKRPGHPAWDLTADHIVALVNGGAALDRANVRILCRTCNGRAGLSVVARRRHAQVRS